jgi:CHAT domain-containing protein/Tfp pilus assembly protein PilF
VMKLRLARVFAWRILSLALCGVPVSAVAQQADINAIYKAFQGDYARGNYPAALVEAQKYEQAVKVRFGSNHPNYAAALYNLANVYTAQRKYAEAEGLYKRALPIFEHARGANQPELAATLNNLANVNADQGKYAEAEGLFKRALAITEKAVGANHPDVAGPLNNLAIDYKNQGKYAEAEGLYKRALAVTEQALGANHPNVARTLNNLASLYLSQGKYAEAEGLYKRALAIHEQTLGANHPAVAGPLENMASSYLNQGKYAEAEGLYKRALAIREQALGANQPDVARILNNLALVYRKQGKYAEAEGLNKRALAIYEQAFGANHPDVAFTLNDLAILFGSKGDSRMALSYSRKASAAVVAHGLADAVISGQRQGSGGLVAQRAQYFVYHVANLAFAARQNIEPEPTAGREAFEIAQWAIQSSAGAAVQHMAARFASGNGALGMAVRESQDLAALWRERDKALTEGLSKPEGQRSQSLIDTIRGQVAEIDRKLAVNAGRLDGEFPDFAALANPKPPSAEEAQKLLSADEALVFFLAGDMESYVFALTRDAFELKTIPLDAQALSQQVATFRHGLDVETLGRGLARVECTQAEVDKRGLSRKDCDQILTKECAQAAADDRGLVRIECKQAADHRSELFDLGIAYQLYQSLIGPVETLVKDKHQLLIVPSGALTALPFHLLVTEKPAVAVPQDLAGYRDAAWLLKRQAVTVLPSVASLKALRAARKDQAGKPMVGFGDPVFDPDGLRAPAGQRTASRTATPTRAYTEFRQGAEGDHTKLSRLPPLPETADELNAIAKKLGAPASDIHLRADASVTSVKRAPLSDYRIVYFATHGLVAGDVKGLAEPSLALSIPRQPSDYDDGLLRASEVAQLKLNADWVVLSACNTIAGDKPGAEALSGLARAFFYAGARALLVSHWSVDSNAATRLTTSTFDYLKADPTISRAEALRRAMLDYLNDGSDPRNAYPAYWAPFELVGDAR